MDHASFTSLDCPTTPVAPPTTLARTTTGLRPVINATGVLLHSGLGRAPLSAAARAAIDLAAGTTDVELDLATGRRGRRGRTALAALAAEVPAAAGVHVVNNNAAALILAVTALAGRGEVVVSRGELIETTDGFRLPELLVSTGARLREVGTTNRTTLGDYADAIGPETGFVLRVHPSSYRVVGLTDAPAVSDLAALCADYGVPLIGDCGSGLIHPERLLAAEPDATTWLDLGVDVVTTSGDKLLGGPQCGLLMGRADLIDRMRRHPMARALRAGKLTLAALEATLGHPDSPVRQALHASPARLTVRAETLAAWLRQAGIAASAVASSAVIDGGGTTAGGHHPFGPGERVAYRGDRREFDQPRYDGHPQYEYQPRYDGHPQYGYQPRYGDRYGPDPDDRVGGDRPSPVGDHGAPPAGASRRDAWHRSGDDRRDELTHLEQPTAPGYRAYPDTPDHPGRAEIRALGGLGPELPSAAVALDEVIAAPLRRGEPSVLGRVEQGCCLLDLRTVPPELDPVLAAAVLAAATEAGATTLTDAPTEPNHSEEADVVTIESVALPPVAVPTRRAP